MKINKLDYVRTEAFTYNELRTLESLMLEQGILLIDEVDTDFAENWIEYGVDESGYAVFWDTHFLEKWEGNDITEQFRDYLDKRRADVEKEESSDSNPFTKEDLKDGMVVTFRDIDFEEGVVFRGAIFATDGSSYAKLSSGGIPRLEELLGNLVHDGLNDYDIMKVSYMDEVLWERVEETPEQKRIKELEKIISEAQKELEELRED